MVGLLIALATFDARLDVRASLDAPRLTYAELGAWVQKTTGVPVTVSPVIRERKITIYVEDRPVREIMDRVAETMWVAWEPDKNGLKLKMPTKVLNEEVIAQKATSEAKRQDLIDLIDLLVKYADKTKEEAKALAQQKSSPRPADPRTSQEVGVLYQLMQGTQRGLAMLLAQLSPVQRGGLLTGEVYRNQNFEVTEKIIDSISESFLTFKQAKAGLFEISVDPTLMQLKLQLVDKSDTGTSGTTWSQGVPGGSASDALKELAIRRRIEAWVKIEDPVRKTPLKPKVNRPEPMRMTEFRSAAEVLRDLHERSGMPIVADGSRAAFAAQTPPVGDTIEKWLSSARIQDSAFRGYRLRWRLSEGWIMARHGDYWNQLLKEVPEAPIRRLEAAGKRATGPTLDDFAAFAAALPPAFDRYVRGEDLVAEAPYHAYEGNLPTLRLWNLLPGRLREMAWSNSGLDTAVFSGNQVAAFQAVVDSQSRSLFNRVVMQEDPRAAYRFFAIKESSIAAQPRVDFARGGYGFDSRRDGVPGVMLFFGPSQNIRRIVCNVPLSPQTKVRYNDGTIGE